MESYPVAELVGARVDAVTREGQAFAVRTADGKVFHAQAIVYCAGKEYKRLGVPGEERFLGHGIAFCATCDAPLYTDRTVAVVGGGNSALTAVRDLLSFAREVHVIHRRESFKADAALVDEVKGHPRVRLHAPYEVVSFVGDERLTGAEIRSADGQTETLAVDGVFLEIGLVPNTAPVKDIVQLNERDEIPIQADHSTALAGLFAAGDATSVPEKQIAIAVGGGALAALTAYRYLVENRLVTPKAGVDDDWA
jgi:alkyl hydroperoxide reductase subunit F